ncbi:unnamed protein product [Cuscuta epithymum]|uniref:Reverse transcriptase Ty1/copia-type domain-containing protein n=1 Tax=Cuscuta epithymum TaxID=186058 RepID=A0AAV0FMV3_9ASTE|nr:unnamed protein product [Cuscuta epithymum]
MGMGDCNPCSIPMEPRSRLSKFDEGMLVDATLYRSVVGSLRYLVNTRPDMAYSVGMVSRYMEVPTQNHMNAVKQILRYIKGTYDMGCVFKYGEEDNVLVGYCDSDLAGDVDDRKSTTRILFFLGGSPITWVSQKQKVVAPSSCEAEYMAATGGACQGIWLMKLLDSLRRKIKEKPLLKIDNKSAIALANNLVHHERSKHIDTKFHFIRECIEKGIIGIEHVRTEGQLADILTKPLGRQRFTELRTKIGIQHIKMGKQV